MASCTFQKGPPSDGLDVNLMTQLAPSDKMQATGR